MHSIDVFRHYERNHWRLSDVDFGAIRRDLVRPEYVTMARSSVMGESNVVAAVHGFLNEFVDDYDFSSFAVVWGYQEVQHHNAFRAWLRELGRGRRRRAGGGDAGAVRAGHHAERHAGHQHHLRADRQPRLQEPGPLRRGAGAAGADAQRQPGRGRRTPASSSTTAAQRLRRHPDELASVLETLYVYTADTRIKHPVSMFKDSLAELPDHETIDTGFELFLEQVADAGELAELQAKIRKTFAGLTDLDLSSNSRVRRALAEQLA